MRLKILFAVASLTLVSACAPTFTAQVARFQVLPPPTGQSFTIEPLDPAKVGSIEFATFAGYVRRGLIDAGFVEAPTPTNATLIAKFDYNVMQGPTQINSTPGWGPACGGWGCGAWGAGAGWGRYGGWGGWGGWGGGWAAPQIYSTDTWNAWTELHIDRAADKTSLFEGRAQTNSTQSAVTFLVPNLVRALFTDFPGVSGQTTTVTFDPTRPPVAPTPVAAVPAK
ncbi:DUF4136 domain-containing protein [Polymorphobacter arshaanensis]|uniref:DUF4136 domain-containing protein n=1 Tax=Glacieibacterium arshaanense TaxID=2511025 RepID=A0A4Y9EQ39_9SPHN|nr:DUF4136 domain-containing protein [Polymorphobacter arshaanensis]TFU05727.1 DUF4136 domain-containing protein [Polymorphobacter arshaanensis]